MLRFFQADANLTYNERTGEVCDRICRADARVRNTVDKALRNGWRPA